jgi:hypothetical protein
MTGMSHVLETIVVLIGGGSLGSFGLYMGYKLSRYRLHRKNEEVQTVFTRTNLD